jgi:hypothetical protein
MASGVSVNFSLAKMARSTPKLVAELIDSIADAQRVAGQKGFQTGKGPQDETWKVTNNPTPLVDTGKASKGFFVSQRAKPSEMVAIIRFPKDRGKIMGFHQDGKGNNPARKSVPEGGKIYKRSAAAVKRRIDIFENKMVKSVK